MSLESSFSPPRPPCNSGSWAAPSVRRVDGSIPSRSRRLALAWGLASRHKASDTTSEQNQPQDYVGRALEPVQTAGHGTRADVVRAGGLPRLYACDGAQTSTATQLPVIRAVGRSPCAPCRIGTDFAALNDLLASLVPASLPPGSCALVLAAAIAMRPGLGRGLARGRSRGIVPDYRRPACENKADSCSPFGSPSRLYADGWVKFQALVLLLI